MTARGTPSSTRCCGSCPRVERGESLNAGVLVYCRQRDYLGSRVHLDAARLRALDPTADADAIAAALQAGRRRLRGRGRPPVPPGGRRWAAGSAGSPRRGAPSSSPARCTPG